MKPKSKIKRLLKKGIETLNAGNLGEAQSLCHEVLAIDPENAGAYHLGSSIARAAGDMKTALAYAKQAALIRPCSAYYFCMSTLLGDLGMMDESAFLLESTLNLEPGHTTALLNLGLIRHDAGQIEEAKELYGRAAEASPNIIEPLTRLGSIHHQAGEFDKAMEYYRAAQEKNTEFIAQAWYHISGNKKFVPGDPDIPEMECVYRDTTDQDQKSFISFALGKAYEDVGKYEKSFEKLAEGNKIRRAAYSYKPEDDQKFLRGIADYFGAELLAGEYGGCLDKTPIFILGMPRSGTTLTEHILSSHPDVEGAGEVKHLDDIVTSGGPDYPSCVDLEKCGAMGREYVKRLREGKIEARRISSKMPYDFFHVGMIKLILPNAKVIHCQRSKPATCFSIWKTHFFRTHKYSHDLKELSAYYDEYERLMVHWYRVLPGFFYDLTYEQLVSDPEHEIRKLLEFCELEYHPDCLEFHKNKRAVLTASASQVRKPMYKGAIDKWKSYEKHLGEIM